MGLLKDIATDRRKILIVAALILLLAVFVRFYHIQWSFSNNGVDEGIMIQRSRLVSEGYALYSELPSDQAPLAFYIGAPFGGDVVSLRALSASLSVLAIGAVMLAAKKVKGNVAMIVTGLLLSLDFAFLRESRLFSLDGISASFLAFSLLAFIIYLQKGSRLSLVACAFLVGLSTATKLFGVLGLIGMIIFMVLEARRDKAWGKGKLVDLLLMLVAAAIPLAAFLLYLGPSDMIQGMVLNQGQRSFEPWLKLSLVAYLGLNLAYLVPLIYFRRTWSLGKEARFLLCTSAVILAFMVLQPLTFFHHLVLLSPPLAVLAGVCANSALGSKKENVKNSHESEKHKNGKPLRHAVAALVLVSILTSGGLAGYGLVRQETPTQVSVADFVNGMTPSDAWVISGDPLICAYADRNIPPEVVNVAYRQHPDLTLDDIERAIVNYNVTVVVVCYRLAKLDGLVELLAEYNFTLMFPRINWGIAWQPHPAVLDLFQEDLGPVSIYWRGLES